MSDNPNIQDEVIPDGEDITIDRLLTVLNTQAGDEPDFDPSDPGGDYIKRVLRLFKTNATTD